MTADGSLRSITLHLPSTRQNMQDVLQVSPNREARLSPELSTETRVAGRARG